jgi:thioredoxin reductase (NADPH)
MSLPVIMAVDDDLQVLQAISRDLKSKYRAEYRIVSTTSATEALSYLEELRRKNEDVALLLSDQRMPEMLGVEFLEKAKKLFPKAKRILLTAYSDTDAAIRAINEVQLHYYLTKPWDPPEEKLYPVLNDQLEEWFMHYIPEGKGIRLIGFQYAPLSHQIKDFLTGNLIPYRWLDVESQPEAEELMLLAESTIADLPLVLLEDGSILKRPSPAIIAEKMGRPLEAKQEVYDVAIIGAGPAGLAASVYGGSEGLKTILIEKRAPGGQAGTSSRIENYLGFPSGLSGADLTRRAITQATRFGVEFFSPQSVQQIELRDQYKVLRLEQDKVVVAKAIVITTGVEYRQLGAKNEENFTGAGIYYGAANTEAYACKDREVYIVGGGNSAGQAAMYLSTYAKRVHLVIRRNDLSETMSQYLIDQISKTETIEVVPFSEIVEVNGAEKLEQLCLKNIRTGAVEVRHVSALFIFIGAKPNTSWLPPEILLDEKGYIETGRDLSLRQEFKNGWKQKREPYLLETSMPGIFAAGDVRSGAMNRVASAVGEGSMSISFVHRYLAEN